MAVKQRQDKPPEVMNLAHLTSYIRALTEQLNDFPPADPIATCASMVSMLSRVPIPREAYLEDNFYAQLNGVEVYLQCLLADLSEDLKEGMIYGILREVFNLIAKPSTAASPVLCVLLTLVHPSVINSAVIWLIGDVKKDQQDEEEEEDGEIEEPADLMMCPVTPDEMRQALLTLCNWLCYWRTPVLSPWVQAFVTNLQDSGKYDILIDVALDTISPMFEALAIPKMRPLVSGIFLHVLACMRHTTEAFELIAFDVPSMLELLACDSHSTSRPLLQTLVETLSSLLDEHPSLKTAFPEITLCLDSHIKSDQDTLQKFPIWKAYDIPSDAYNKLQHNVGLVNIGNTCYMNSIFQALMMTKGFSNGLIMAKGTFPLISRLGALFAHMMYSERPCVLSNNFLDFARQINFTHNFQHDSSEFLSHLLERLHEQERLQVWSQGRMLINGKLVSSEMAMAMSQEIATAMSLSQEMVMTMCVSENLALTMSNNAELAQALTITFMEDVPRSLSPAPDDSPARCDSPEPGCSSAPPMAYRHPVYRAAKHKRRDPVAEMIVAKRQRTGDCRAIYTLNLQMIPDKYFFPTIVQKAFGGLLTTTIKCMTCNFMSSKTDRFRDLQLAFPAKNYYDYNRGNKRPYYSVQQLVDYYFQTEHLTGDNKYRCSRCTELRDAERSIVVEEAPKNLILILKHFWYDTRRQIRSKLLERVNHDKTVSLKHGDKTLLYDLYGAVVHSGSQMDSGHYYTMARDGPRQWVKLNDHWVTQCTEQDLHKLAPPNTPYILFYRQRRDRTEAAVEDEEPFDLLEDNVPFAYLPLLLKEQIRADNSLYRSQPKKETRPMFLFPPYDDDEFPQDTQLDDYFGPQYLY